MSGAPKRLHEEGGHAMNPKHTDGRLAKVARTEPSDADKRSSPLPQMNRLSSSSNDAYLEHFVTSENKLESRNSKDDRDVKVDNRATKAETREVYPETKIDTQCTRVEKDVRLESRGNDNKEMKHDRDTNMDFKSEVKMGKDAFSTGNSHLNWKDIKEHHWAKRYPDLSGDSLDPWHISQSSLRGTNEIGKEASTTEDRNYTEAHEAVGENKVDARGDDKLKEKERKRKDEKHKDWGERDKERNERHNNMQLGYNPSERRESMREEKELDRREREKKDFQKDKEQPKEKESDNVKKETLNGIEKEDSRCDKDVINGSVKIPEQESSAVEQKRQKEFDNWKVVDRDAKDRKKERDVDLEVDKQEKRNRFFDKELDDSCTEGDGGVEREVFGGGVQQRKRMLRPRGSPQMAIREPRFRSRVADNDGSQGKPEVSTVVYKAGECMQELLKLWKQFETSQDNRNDESSHTSPTLEIRVPAEYVTATNHQVRGGQLWGTDIYTDDSDLVAVLMHTGYCRPTSSPPPPAIQELRATIRVLPPQDCYTSTLRNNVRSRAWGAAIGCSFCVERCCIVKKGGGTVDLEPCLTHTSVLEPTLAPMAVERTMTTRSAASNALRQQRFVREVTIQYNLCNEPWIKYSISVVADKGLKKPLYTSARLKKGEVLYLETHSNRYELCFNGEKMVSAANVSQGLETETHKLRSLNLHVQNGERNMTDRDTVAIDVFRWSRCKKPLPQKVMCSIGIPQPLEHLEVLEENLDWEDVQWSQTGVWVAGKEYVLARVHFLSPN